MLGRVLFSALTANFGVSSAATVPRPLCPAAVRLIDASAAQTLKQGSPGMIVAIAREDRPLFIKGYGMANLEHDAPVTRETVFRLASVTKQFTAAAVLQLAEEGRLALDDKLSTIVPEMAHAGEVTLYQLLSQTSGIPDYAEDLKGLKTKSVARSSEEMLTWISRLKPPLLFKPGSKWAYSNSNYALLGLILERVDRKPLQQVFQDRLLTRAQLRQTTFDDESDIVLHRAEGYRLAKLGPARFRKADLISYTVPGAAGGLRTTVDDLIRWENALFAGRVLKPAALKQMVSPALLNNGQSTKFGMPTEWQKGLNSDYGMGVFITPSAAGTRIWHSGDMDGFSTWVAHYPERKITIALMINSESADMDKEAIEKAAMQGLGC